MDGWETLCPTLLHHLIYFVMTDTIKPQELATFALPGGWMAKASSRRLWGGLAVASSLLSLCCGLCLHTHTRPPVWLHTSRCEAGTGLGEENKCQAAVAVPRWLISLQGTELSVGILGKLAPCSV